MLEQAQQTKKRFQMTDRTSYTMNRDKKQQATHGMMGSTWDAEHLTTFLNRSFYSSRKFQEEQVDQYGRTRYSSPRNSKKLLSTTVKGDFFFKNLRQDKNASKFGYTNVNPLVANNQVSKERQKVLENFFLDRMNNQSQQKQYKNKHLTLRCSQDSKFKYQGNAAKYRLTDPLTCRHEPKPVQKVGFSVQRMKRQIQSRYPHGISGIDNPQQIEPKFYELHSVKNHRVRHVPHSQNSFQLDRQWNSKKRAYPKKQEFIFRHTDCLRKFRNQNVHGYDIVTNRKSPEKQLIKF